MNRSIVLTIDTSKSAEASVGLVLDGNRQTLRSSSGKERAQAALPLITQILGENHLTFEDITAIEVVTGPGSFTGLRVGIAVANTLATILDVPINGGKSLARPTYS